ncbi:MAG TPA: GNAT family N-acetyltransferase [Clostridiales bacterium]|nr:GNAT family N-acetyltransferase [Clostridiales bacterium]
MDLFIKKAEEDEIPIIHEITQEAFKKYAMDLGMPHVVSALNETPEDIKTDMEKNNVFIAYLEGEALGSIRYKMLPDNIAYIYRFGVKTKAQNCGVGKALVKVVEEDAIKKGAHMLALHTASKMMPLIRFYYGLGFYIYSTSTDRGYIRALLCKELVEYDKEEIPVVNIK